MVIQFYSRFQLNAVLNPPPQKWKYSSTLSCPNFQINLLTPTSHVMYQQFNIQQLYVLPTLFLCVLCLSENKQRLVPLTA